MKFLQPEPSSLGLVAWWKLYEGTAFDYSLNGNKGTLNGTSLVYDYPGLNLAGSDEYIDTGNAFQSVWRSSYTISMWVKPDDGQPAVEQYLFGSNNSTGRDQIFLRYSSTGTLIFTFRSNNLGATRTSAVLFTNGQQDWHHIVTVGVADTTIGIFFDGVDIGTTNASGLTFNLWTSPIDIFIGGYSNNGSLYRPFAGVIDDVRIYNRALSATNILDIYQLQRHRYQV